MARDIDEQKINGFRNRPTVAFCCNRRSLQTLTDIPSSSIAAHRAPPPTKGERTTDTSILKKQALELMRSWPPEILDAIRSTPDDAVVKTPLVDRWLWPSLSPPASSGKAAVVGDAWHPMTPNLGQGACCALEDSVILAGKLAAALKGGESVEAALRAYGQERWARIFTITARANLVGSLLQWDNPAVCGFRDSVVIPWLVRLGPFLEHTNFACEDLNNSNFLK